MTTTTESARATELRVQPESPAAVDESRAIRVGGAAGIAFVVAGVISNFLPGTPPASNASATRIATYFHDHAGAIKAQNLLGALGVVALLWWFGSLWRLLGRAEAERPRLAIVAAVSFAVGLTLALLDGVLVVTAALRSNSADPSTSLLWSLACVAIAVAGLGLGTFLVATSTLTYRAQIGPRWISYLGGLAALAFFVGSSAMASDGEAINTVNVFAFLIWCVWIVAVSVVMWRATTSSQPA